MSAKLNAAVQEEIRYLESLLWLTPYLGERLSLLRRLASHLEAGGGEALDPGPDGKETLRQSMLAAAEAELATLTLCDSDGNPVGEETEEEKAHWAEMCRRAGVQ